MSIVSEVYRKTRKRPDLFWNTYVCRPPAAMVVAALRSTPVTPNQITFAAFFLALAACGILLVVPGHAGLLVGVVVFQLSYVLDCADGMLARWRNIQSTQGHLLDFLMDEIKAFALLGVASVRLWREHADDRFLVLGIGGLCCLATGIGLTTFQRRPEIAPPPATGALAASQAPSKSLVKLAIGLVERIAKFLIHYPSYLLYVAIAGRLEAYLLPYVAVNALYAARALASVMLRFGRPERPKSSDAEA